MLVHGEAAKMEFLRQKVMQEFGVNCFMPPNGETVTIKTTPTIPVDMSRMLFKRTFEQSYCKQLVHQWTNPTSTSTNTAGPVSNVAV